MICLGETHRANDIRTIGSNYYFAGGIIDGNGKANGISVRCEVSENDYCRKYLHGNILTQHW